MNRRIALSFLFIMLSIGSIVAENVQANQLEYLNNTVIASLKTNEIFIEGLLLPIEDR